MSSRAATHSGLWYSDEGDKLRSQLDTWLDKAHVDIDRHAGYSYSGETAAHSYYQLLQIPVLKRILLIGPSHHTHLRPSVQQTFFDRLDTPLGQLKVMKLDHNSIPLLSTINDEREHSLEMQFPFIKHILDLRQDSQDVTVTPLLIGHLTDTAIQHFSQKLTTMLKEEGTVLIVSSDFCHWGTRFEYAPMLNVLAGDHLYQRIKTLDMDGFEAINNGREAFEHYIQETGNTVCGREPIRLALEICKNFNGQWKLLHYAQSSKTTSPTESSSQVSYLSASFSSA